MVNDVGRAGEAPGRLARRHPYRMDGADRRGRYRIKPDQRARGHYDLPAMLAGELDQVGIFQ